MEGQTRPNSGQAIVESIFGITVVTLIIVLTTTVAMVIRKNLKHDYVPSTNQESPAFDPNPLAQKLVFFDGTSRNRNLHALTSTGWQIKESFKVNDDLYYLLNKNGQQMVFSNQLGVKICTGICLND